MKVLILGGTGAMGSALVELLKRGDSRVTVTSRSKRQSSGNIVYVQGNAKDDNFLSELLKENFDAIVDFMVYSSSQFANRLKLLLQHTNQYFYFSSSRVYAQSQVRLTEESPRLLDVCTDREYLETDEYALAKVREEDILKNSNYSNWTIIRPYITYNSQRLQLGVYEKENWLYRALKGRTIVLPRDIANCQTSLTYGKDVANAIVKLIGNPHAFGETFHIVTEEHHTWEEVLNMYCDILEDKTGKRPDVKFVDSSDKLQSVWNKYQIKYDRLYNRVFDSSKIKSVCGFNEFTSLKDGLAECVETFLSSQKWLGHNWKCEAYFDRVAKEQTSLREIPNIKSKLKYLVWRYVKLN